MTSGRSLARLLEPGRAVGRLEHVHALRLEVHAAEQPDRRLVVDYEHFGHAEALGRRRLYIHYCRSSLPAAGSSNDEARALAFGRLDPDPPAHRGHEPLRDEEAEPGARRAVASCGSAR